MNCAFYICVIYYLYAEKMRKVNDFFEGRVLGHRFSFRSKNLLFGQPSGHWTETSTCKMKARYRGVSVHKCNIILSGRDCAEGGRTREGFYLTLSSSARLVGFFIWYISYLHRGILRTIRKSEIHMSFIKGSFARSALFTSS